MTSLRRNPYTNLEYGRCSNWRPKLSRFDELLPPTTTEFKIRQQILGAFVAQGQGTGITVRTPVCAPITSDLKLEHTSGISVFIEIKVSALRLRDTEDGGVRLEHSHVTSFDRDDLPNKGIFTFMASWDYLFSLPSASANYALMIKRDDVPRGFWHRVPTGGDWLFHDYPNTTFTDTHKVRLNAGQAALVNDICSIIMSDEIPQKATLTVKDVIDFAGPCPPGLITRQTIVGTDLRDDTGQERGVLDDDDDDESFGEDEEDGVATGEKEEEEEEASDEEAAPEADPQWQGIQFVPASRTARTAIQPAREMVRLTQLFTLLMNESRHR